MTNANPVLVSGPPRGGTTWVGRVLSMSATMAYLHEPFSPNWYARYRPGICLAQFDTWFTYIDHTNEQKYLHAIEDLLAFRYRPLQKLGAIRTPKDSARLIRDWVSFEAYRVLSKRPLVKDPIAIMSVDWLASRFDMDVVLLSRHPAAFVSSVKRLGWRTDLTHILRQERLMEGHLEPFRDELQRLVKTDHDLIDNAVMLWRLIHWMLLQYKNANPEWLFVRHEDIALNPIAYFTTICQHINLPLSESLHSFIKQTTRSSNPGEVSISQRHSIFRHSESAVRNWTERLSREEIARIKAQTWDIASLFYEDEYWVTH